MNKIFGSGEFLKKLFVIAIPIGLQSVVNIFVNLIDTVMVGRLGDIALSSVNISGQFPYLYMTVAMGLSNAGLIIAAQAWGNERPDKVKDVIAHCLRLCMIVNIVFFLLAFILPKQIISIYTDNDSIIESASVYLRILSVCFLFQTFPQALVTLLRSVGVNRLGFTTSLFACFANVFFNWVFIFGNLGAPALGVTGAAVGTVLARVAELIVIIVFMIRQKYIAFSLRDLARRLDPSMRADFTKLAVPSVLSEVTGNLNVSAAAMITGRVSEYYIAANTIVHNIWTVSSLFMFGIATGANVMIGHEIGASNMERTREYAKYMTRISVVIGLFGAVMTQLIAPVITSFFNVSPQTLETAEHLKYAASVAVFFLAMQIVLTKGILRGGGQAAAVTRVDLLSCWLINIPVGFVVALVLRLDPFWIYLSLRLDYIIKTVWGLWRINRTDWILRLNVD